ncbi:hypothetical protein LEP1GSC043_4026 [Leptospira weilii str. Ecochallenge]|uniref:Uncharacterized protein n=1 Tax=Leptospira weilii str. Ecochallenge TaxID=1049986 RepID=N1U926_9LEPT|nr:hypothetical protein LEP1GSC043_4026 [Leptospira weilii str. Ecochallenge]
MSVSNSSMAGFISPFLSNIAEFRQSKTTSWKIDFYNNHDYYKLDYNY